MRLGEKETGDHSRTVLVDMDGVLADFDGFILEKLPKNLARVARRSFYLHHDYPTHEEQIRMITGHPEFFSELPLVDNALEGWQRLIDLGYDPRICSAPLMHNKRTIEGKIAWLERHLVPEFGRQVVQRAVIDKRKYEYGGLVLIDDRPDPDTNGGQATWHHVAFDRPYNQDSSARFRLHGWRDENLPNILEQAQLA